MPAKKHHSRVRRANEVVFAGCDFDFRTGKAKFNYKIDGWEHAVHALFHNPPSLDPATWNASLHDLGLACAIDLATASLARRITAAGPFPAGCARPWINAAAKALRVESLAELDLPIHHLGFNVRFKETSLPSGERLSSLPERVLLLMGGGKDSLYSYELLRKAGFDVECFYMTEACRTWQQLRKTYAHFDAEAAQHRAFLNANQLGRLEKRFRRRYPTQFQVGQAVFLSVPYALARRCQYIAIGAERSANAWTGRYQGLPMQHQYEKSGAFFALLNRYLRFRYGGAVQVFSPLHGLFDLGIYARFLSSGQRLLDLQSSCGGSNSYRRHCGSCEKCAFVAALFTALSSDEGKLRTLFPVNPLDDVELFKEWYSGRFSRPFACVGALPELRVALRMGRAQGWSSEIHAYDRKQGRPPGKEALSHYLAAHRSRWIPETIHQRIWPLLQFDDSDLVDLFDKRTRVHH